MTTIKSIQARAEYFGFPTKAWFKGDKMRLYCDAERRDMKVYLELEGDSKDEITGGAYRVFCSTEQHPNWIRSQVKEYRERFMPVFYAYIIEQYRNVDLSGYGEDLRDLVDTSMAFLHDFESREPASEADEAEATDESIEGKADA
ncbi:hypothetical protein [Methylosinus sp. PW1]|uniref:hypothetical protein n=1 Tax=Methylosinus sp. PW1 TaxID=107636 RepID=UPI00055F8C82|nr:hypothetical protein [Methylosinus sp. PW1]